MKSTDQDEVTRRAREANLVDYLVEKCGECGVEGPGLSQRIGHHDFRHRVGCTRFSVPSCDPENVRRLMTALSAWTAGDDALFQRTLEDVLEDNSGERVRGFSLACLRTLQRVVSYLTGVRLG